MARFPETTFCRKVTELVKDKGDCPLPLETIPNNMGINLCSVDAVQWKRQADGQLLELTVKFIPDNGGESKTEAETLRQVETLLREAVRTDGGHHKQWYLEEIARVLEVKLPEHDEGSTP